MVDFVNHPPHYKAYEGLEIIDLTEQMNFNRGNAVKYIARAGLKNPEHEIEDLEKAVWYIRREITRIAWATPEEELEDEPAYKTQCFVCMATKEDKDVFFCGGCGNCLDHCACKKGNEDLRPPKSSFCPHYLRPTFTHLRDNCQRAQIQWSYDLEKFDIGDAHYIARRNVHLTVDEIIDYVRKMREAGFTNDNFTISTYEVFDEG